ncbi:MAG: hypothetical protein RL220_1871, partial [Bacteroidota bacterium]
VAWYNEQGFEISSSEDLTGVPCGEYTLLVTDNNNCTYSEVFNLTCVEPVSITYDVTPNPCSDPNAGQGAIDITSVTGGNGGPYSFEYTGPSCATCNTEDISGLNTGTYVLTITDSQGCEQTFAINVGTNDSFTVTGDITPASCFGVCDGSIDITPVPAGNYSFEWYDNNGNLVATTEDLSNACAGVYFVELTAAGCSGSFSFGIGQPNPIDIQVSSTVVPTCFGQNNGSIDITVTGGVGDFTYEWSAPEGCLLLNPTNEDQSNLYECCYTVVATDASGCSAEETICLDAPNVMDIDVEVTLYTGGYNVSCNDENDGQISVFVTGGTGSYTYDWSDCSDIDNIDVNGPILTGVPAGTYCVEVYDSNGCLATTTVALTEPQPIEDNGTVSNYNGFNISCTGANDGWIAPDFSGGVGTYDIDWITGNIGANAPDADTLFNLSPGTYTVVVTDINFCTNTFVYVLTEPEVLNVVIDFVQDINCFGASDGSIVASADGGTGNYTFEWVDQDGNIYPGSIIGPIPAGTYTVTVTDSNGCSDQATVELTDPEPFNVDLTLNSTGIIYSVSCFGDENAELIANASGGSGNYTYEWTNEDGDIIGTDSSVDGLGAGTYCVTVTDAEGCEITECYEITQPDSPLNVASQVSLYDGGFNISCFGACDGSIDLTTSGGVPGYTWQWNPDQQTTEDLADLCAQLYEVLITDANNCDTLISFDLIEPLPLSINPVTSSYACGYGVSCFGECDGSISVTPNGGVADYTVTWTELGLTGPLSVEDLCAGTYEICVTDAINCQVCQTVIISEPAPLEINSSVTSDCDGNTELCAVVTGGCEDYSYNWSDGSTSGCIDVTDETSYSVDVTDANGCSANFSIDIVAPEILEADYTSVDASCGLCNGSYEITVTGGTLPYSVAGDLVATDLCPGTYNVVVTDANGCSVSIDVVISGPDPYEINISGVNLNCFNDGSGSASISVEGAPGVTYEWTDADGNVIGTDSQISDLQAGTYNVTWTDENGCTGDESINITQPAEIIIDGSSPLYDNGFNISVINGTDGSITTDVSGGVPQYSYEWEGPVVIADNTINPEDLPAGEYVLTVTDANGCTKDTTIILTQPEILDFPTGLSPNGDNQNDTYVIIGVEAYPQNTFKVFNRWGNIVYERSNYQNEWRGQNSDGGDLADGTYFIVFKAGEKEFNTYVDLRR